MINEKDVTELRERIKPYLTAKRYSHTLSVEKEIEKLAEIYLPDKKLELRVAALLHDITKKADFEKQLQYCVEFGIMYSNLSTGQEVLHSLTGAELSEKEFGDLVNSEIKQAIKLHTTGAENMTVFDCLLYLADYIEETRTYDGCRALRSYLIDRLSCGDNKYQVLSDVMLKSMNQTILHLIEKNIVIDKNTIEARNYFLSGNFMQKITE